MLTRYQFNLMKDMPSIKCRCCDNFYGLRKDMYLCSICSENRKDKPQITRSYIANFSYNVLGISPMTSEQFKYIYNSFKNIPKHYSGKYIASLIMERIRSIQSVETSGKPKLFLLTDEQAIKLIQRIGWNEFSDGYQISHAITRWRLHPWCTKNKCWEIFNKSSFCYWGNMGEKPSNKDAVTNIYLRNTSNTAIF